MHLLAFGLGSGCVPRAPGTAGSLLGIPLFLALAGLSLPHYLLATGLLFLVGCWLCGESARLLGVHDAPGIVFDEIVGMLLDCLPLLPALGLSALPLWVGLLLAFVLFRVFDILKPQPIQWIDGHVGGGFGIMLDDLLAGLDAAVLLLVVLLAWPQLNG